MTATGRQIVNCDAALAEIGSPTMHASVDRSRPQPMISSVG